MERTQVKQLSNHNASRTQNAARNAVWAIVRKCVTIVTPFITRTFLIYMLGVEYLGLNSLFVSILQVLNMAELGFGNAIVYSMYGPVSNGDTYRVARLLSYFKRVYRIVGIIILAGGLIVLPFIGHLIKGEPPADVNIYAAYIIFLANTTIGYFLFAYKQSLLNAYQRNDVVSKVSIIIQLIQNVLQITVLLACSDYYLYALVMLIATISSNLITAAIVDRGFPDYANPELKKLELSIDDRKDLRTRVAGLVIQRVCFTTRDTFDSIVISACFGLTTLALFNNYFLVMSSLCGILGSIAQSITASVGNSVAKETPNKNADDLRLFVYLYAAISTVCAACLVSLYQPFMLVWLGSSGLLPFELAIVMTVYFYVRTMGDMWSMYVAATGTWWEQRWRSLSEAVSNVVLVLIFNQILGLVGVVLGTVSSLFLFNFCWGSSLMFTLYFGRDNAGPFYRGHLLYASVAVAVCVATGFAVALVPGAGILSFAIKALLALFISLAIVLTAYRFMGQYDKARALIGRIIHLRQLSQEEA